MKLKTFGPKDVENKKVLVRVDFNVPFKNGKVTDDSRIRAHASTIGKLTDAGAKVALVSHFGRPKGKVVPEMSLGQIVPDVEKAYGRKIRFVDDCVGEKVAAALEALPAGELLLLENSRFYAEEQENDAAFAAKMAKPFDVFVMDAFSAAHRADVTTNGLMSLLPSFAGDVLVREGEMLGAVSENPLKPYVLILGGAKVSDKIDVVGNLLDKATTILIGGGMAYTFLKAQGYPIGKSLCEEDRLDFARETLKKAESKGVKILLPVDSVIADGLDATETAVADSASMPEDKMGLDIGPKTEKLFASALDGAKSILWNGPMGVFENKLFASGTVAVGSAVVQSTAAGATSVIGGGDTAAAVRQFGFAEKVSYVSTGGGASLEYCEGKKLPGMAPLEVNSALKKIYLYGNWKMNMNRGETDAFMKALAAAFASSPELAAANGKTLEIAVFPPFTSIAAAAGANGAALVNVGAQNVYFEPKGAFTGEISIPMLKDAGCTRVILGHSERRHIFGESDELIAKKVKAVLDAGLIPVLCYGETLEEREAGRTAEVVTRQLRTALTGLSSEALEKIVYAYEPVWAIGTGKSATSAEAQEVCADSKKLLAELAGKPISVVVLYGGSVNADNAKELLSMSAIDGALVGGASLKVDSFLQIYVRGAA